MVDEKAEVIAIIKRYIGELKKNNIPVSQAFLFGSFVRGGAKPESDIDIAIISEVFTGDRFEDRRRIVPIRRKIDSRIEPIPFKPEDFNEGGILAEEIKKTGIAIL
jgi:hypothetical protein